MALLTPPSWWWELFLFFKKKKSTKNEFKNWILHHEAKDYGPRPFLLRVSHYCLLTISAHKGPWTIHECKMDTAQIDSVTSHRHVWIMRFGCSLSHSKHISVTDLLKTWVSRASFLEKVLALFFFFPFWESNRSEQTNTLRHLKCVSWIWHTADLLPISQIKKGRGGGSMLPPLS